MGCSIVRVFPFVDKIVAVRDIPNNFNVDISKLVQDLYETYNEE